MINWIKKQIAKRKIPKGSECCFPTSYMFTMVYPEGLVVKTRRNITYCPFFEWYEISVDGGIGNMKLCGSCKYLEEDDSSELDNLRKICGVNQE